MFRSEEFTTSHFTWKRVLRTLGSCPVTTARLSRGRGGAGSVRASRAGPSRARGVPRGCPGSPLPPFPSEGGLAPSPEPADSGCSTHGSDGRGLRAAPAASPAAGGGGGPCGPLTSPQPPPRSGVPPRPGGGGRPRHRTHLSQLLSQ